MTTFTFDAKFVKKILSSVKGMQVEFGHSGFSVIDGRLRIYTIEMSVPEEINVIFPYKEFKKALSFCKDMANIVYDGQDFTLTNATGYQSPLVHLTEFEVNGEEYFEVIGTVDAKEFAKGVRTVCHARSNNKYNKALTGVNISILDKKLYAVATDTFRMCASEINADGLGDDISITLVDFTEKAFDLFRGQITLMKSNSYLRIKGDETTMTVFLADGLFPCWKSVLPDARQLHSGFLINRSNLQGALKPYVTKAKKDVVKVEVKNDNCVLNYRVYNEDFSSTGTVDCQTFGEWTSFKVNNNFLNQILSECTSEELTVHVITADRAPILYVQDGENTFMLAGLVQ